MSKVKWTLDPAHSEIEFKVRHMMISNVKGSFDSFNAEIDGEDFQSGKIHVEVDASSINTGQEDRDKHLESKDFFDVAQYPKIIFEGEKMLKKSENSYVLEGKLTIRDITKPLSLNVEYGGMKKDPWGNEKVGFSIDGKFNRKDWGLGWNTVLETGGVMVGEEVKINAEVQFAKQA
ncbi:MAG TPA: YceI family protein [Chitinophagaceae bacterium]|nr:YceI family protein [Chitinophagaceae bacterium]